MGFIWKIWYNYANFNGSKQVLGDKMTQRKPLLPLVLLALAIAVLVIWKPQMNFQGPVTNPPVIKINDANIDVPDPSAEIDLLRDLAGDLRMLDLPDGFEDLFDPDLEFVDYDNIQVPGPAITEYDHWHQEMLRLFNPQLSEELDRLAQDLQDAMENYEPKEWIPEEVREATRQRILIKEILAGLATQIRVIEAFIEQIRAINPALAEELTQELMDVKTRILNDVSYLFGSNFAMMDLVKNFLNGSITEEEFRQQYNNLLPDFTWTQ